MKKFLIGTAFMAMTLASPASAATTIFFSDFENQSPGTTSGFTTVNTADVWTKEDTTAGIELQFGNTGGAPYGAGNRVKVELDSKSNSGMYYTIQNAGVYTLSFLFSPRPGVGSDSNLIDLILGNTVIGSYNGNSFPSTTWSQNTKNFTAQAGQKLIFRAGGKSDSLGGYLDNIKLEQVSAVPEPSTWIMMLFGFGLVGFSMRRRQKNAVRYSFA
jgi:PEP-CTERM motif